MVEIAKNDTIDTATDLGTLAFATNPPTDTIGVINVIQFDDVWNESGSDDLVDYYRFESHELARVRVTFDSHSTLPDYANYVSVRPISGVSKIVGDTTSVHSAGAHRGANYEQALTTGCEAGMANYGSRYGIDVSEATCSLNEFPGAEAIWYLTGEPVVFEVRGFEWKGTYSEVEALSLFDIRTREVDYDLAMTPNLGTVSADSTVAFTSLTSATYDRGDGFDQVTFTGNRSAYTITGLDMGANSVTVNGAALLNVERLVFADQTLALDDEAAAGQTYRLYQAAFARAPDQGGLGHNVRLMDGDYTLKNMANAFIGSAEFIQKYGSNTTDTAYINALYNNVLGRNADDAGLTGWLQRLSDGSYDRADVLIGFSESAENQALVGQTIEPAGIWFT